MGPDLQPAQPPNSEHQEANPATSSGRFSLPVGIKINTWNIGETQKGPRTPTTPSVYTPSEYSRLGSTPGTNRKRSRNTPRDPPGQPHSSSVPGIFPGWGMGPTAGQQFWQQPPWYPSYWMPPPWQFPGQVNAQEPAMQHPQLPARLVVQFNFLST